MTSGRVLAPLVDNTDEWINLREGDYDRDERLQLCDICNIRQFARNATGAFLHNDGNKALPDPTEEYDGEIPVRIRRRLAALRSSADYRQAFGAASHRKTWSMLHTFSDQLLDHESV